MPTPMNDQLRAPRGEFLMHTYVGGVLVDTYHDANLIVDGSKRVHAHLLGGDFSGNKVTQVAFGTNGTPPVGGNTQITAPFVKPIGSVTYAVDGQVTFNFTLGSGEANGMAIFEFGLLTEGGALYARKVRTSALAKESDVSLSVAWTIYF